MDTNKPTIDLSANVRRQVHGFAARVKTIAPDAQTIVFGSTASGTATPLSDIDVCVVTQKFAADYHAGTTALLRIAHEFPIPMDVIPYTPQDLDNKYDPLAREIRTKGIPIL